MSTYEVRIGYRGINVYYVEAEDDDAAKKRAEMRYSSGDNGEEDGTTWEQIDSISSMTVDTDADDAAASSAAPESAWPLEDMTPEPRRR